MISTEWPCALPTLGEVRHIHDNRPDVARQPLLGAERTHPGPAALRRPGEVVAEEEAHVAAAGLSRTSQTRTSGW